MAITPLGRDDNGHIVGLGPNHSPVNLNDFATKSELAEAQLQGADVDLSPYATSTELAQALAGKANVTDVPAAYDDSAVVGRLEILERVDLSGFATKAELAALPSGGTQISGEFLDNLELVPSAAGDGTLVLRVKSTGVPLMSLYVPDSYEPSGARTIVMGDSHSDQNTMYSPGQLWWMRALPEAGALAIPGRYGMEARAGWSLQSMVSDGSQTGGVPLLDAALSHRPDTLVVMAGGNDAVQGTAASFSAALDQAVARAKAAGAQLVFVFPPPLFEDAPYDETVLTRYREIRMVAREKAAQHGFPYFDIWDVHDPAPRDWAQADNTHLTTAAHFALGELIAPFLRTVIQPVALGSTPWITSPRYATEVYDGATAPEITAPEGFTGEKAIQLVSPSGGYAAVQSNIGRVSAGERLDVACRFRIEANTSSSGGFTLAVIDLTRWEVVRGLGPIRFSDFEGVGGISWTADKDYTNLRLAAVVRETDSAFTVVVGDTRYVRTPAA